MNKKRGSFAGEIPTVRCIVWTKKNKEGNVFPNTAKPIASLYQVTYSFEPPWVTVYLTKDSYLRIDCKDASVVCDVIEALWYNDGHVVIDDFRGINYSYRDEDGTIAFFEIKYNKDEKNTS